MIANSSRTNRESNLINDKMTIGRGIRAGWSQRARRCILLAFRVTPTSNRWRGFRKKKETKGRKDKNQRKRRSSRFVARHWAIPVPRQVMRRQTNDRIDSTRMPVEKRLIRRPTVAHCQNRRNRPLDATPAWELPGV